MDDSRRKFLLQTASAGAALALQKRLSADLPTETPADDVALVVISLDLEMSAGYPVKGKPRATYPWDYQKGNLNEETKQYTVEACRRVKAKGGVLHSFVVGQVFEQKNVDWLKTILAEGHPLGNHTYDHVRITATKSADVQYRFRRSPWLMADKSPLQAIAENIRLCEMAMQQRLGVKPTAFGAPYAFNAGIADREDLQQVILSLGYEWISSKYNGVELPRQKPQPKHFQAVAESLANHQPYYYPTGLLEVPYSPVTDVGAFRSRQWTVDEYCDSLTACIDWAIEHRAVYNWCSHPSVLYVEDPEFRIVETICELVNASAGKALIVDRTAVAARAMRQLADQKPPGT